MFSFHSRGALKHITQAETRYPFFVSTVPLLHPLWLGTLPVLSLVLTIKYRLMRLRRVTLVPSRRPPNHKAASIMRNKPEPVPRVGLSNKTEKNSISPEFA